MNRELALQITHLLASQQQVQVITDFADALIEKAKINLVGASDFNQVRYQQGVIAACQEFKKIRDTAVAVVNKEK